MQNYGSMAAPLTQLLETGAYHWNEKASVAFEKLKTTMMTLPVLAMPDFNLPFEIEIDASGFSVGQCWYKPRDQELTSASHYVRGLAQSMKES